MTTTLCTACAAKVELLRADYERYIATFAADGLVPAVIRPTLAAIRAEAQTIADACTA